MDQGLASRLAALNALSAVFEAGQPLDQALDKFAGKYNLDAQDRAFARSLCGYVLRHKPDLQEKISNQAKRQAEITPRALNTVLLMGLAQMALMNVPDHAAIDTSVRLAEKIKCDRQKGFVNAILRNMQRGGVKEITASLPQWLVKTWGRDYDKATAKIMEQASLREARLSVTDKMTGENRLLDYEGAIITAPGYTDGAWWVQDFASHLPVALLGDTARGKQVLDLCAAPGGKTMQLAARGANLTAVDISEKRLSRLKDNLDRTGLADRVKIVCADLLKWQPEAQADIVVLDAPCSATGTIRRHPDLPYLKTTQDIKTLVTLQARLLDRVHHWVRPDGLLVYCTCSLQKDEGERQIASFLKKYPHFVRATTGCDAYAVLRNGDGDWRLLPCDGDQDGFFISILKNGV